MFNIHDTVSNILSDFLVLSVICVSNNNAHFTPTLGGIWAKHMNLHFSVLYPYIYYQVVEICTLYSYIVKKHIPAVKLNIRKCKWILQLKWY